jgi:hypothetical protein
VGGKVDITYDGDKTSAIRNTEFARHPDDAMTDWLNVGREIEVITVTAEEASALVVVFALWLLLAEAPGARLKACSRAL